MAIPACYSSLGTAFVPRQLRACQAARVGEWVDARERGVRRVRKLADYEVLQWYSASMMLGRPHGVVLAVLYLGCSISVWGEQKAADSGTSDHKG